MSFLLGPISGALAAGGIYYGLSNLINTRTEQLRADISHISRRLVEEPTVVAAPLPAAARIVRKPFADMLQEEWNRQVEALFKNTGRLDQSVVEWGRKLVHGQSSPRS
ncbi:hypothetical protein PUNSTDRAFT_130146 [Punctularia strigosozonata HHB-11173 SS5]|uniref:uncharacterized protein n=1 Tax=Punctularia strigosozonata (strain HHB-11173) TaxID=741275 RepID=UPI00044177B0|nr:uncharacterized protein PUNSTDRAFT_130146 [Punctularia strigosozonata HHB-11173 SS5]EIN14520.1 hypothetical protein PUNSTDRAFT_130146 [Punctularia strigosozonata HHB-11173 SS5]